MKITEHFTTGEFEFSQTAVRLGINNHLPPELFPKMEALCKHVLEPIRAHFGPVHISSGYRCPRLNKAIGGSQASQHQRGEAADIVIAGHAPLYIAQWIVSSGLEFDQCIYEGRWVHVSYHEGSNRRNVLTAFFGDGKATYMHGIMENGNV